MSTLTKPSLTSAQRSRKEELERIITDDFKAFIRCGEALCEIRDSGLYLDEHDTFKEYVDEKWGMSQSRAYQLISGARAAKRVQQFVELPNEGAARALNGLTDVQQIKVAKRVGAKLKKSGKQRATAAIIEIEAEQVVPRSARGGLAASLSEAKSAGIIKDRHQVVCPTCKGKGLIWEDAK